MTANQAKLADVNSVGRKIKNKDKVATKIHKAEREKLKRYHLNDLFSGLSQALVVSTEPCQQKDGKASILAVASRALRGLLTEVDHLKQENAALLTESRYITEEKNELRDEKAMLEAEINKLQTQLEERTQAEAMWTNSTGAPPSSSQPHAAPPMLSSTSNLLLPPAVETLSHVMGNEASWRDHATPSVTGPAALATDQVAQPVVQPLVVFPLRPDMQTLSKPNHGSETHALPPHHVNSSSNVRRPHARYPTRSDLWASLLLTDIQGQFLTRNS